MAFATVADAEFEFMHISLMAFHSLCPAGCPEILERTDRMQATACSIYHQVHTKADVFAHHEELGPASRTMNGDHCLQDSYLRRGVNRNGNRLSGSRDPEHGVQWSRMPDRFSVG
jgi:hypothetical protein